MQKRIVEPAGQTSTNERTLVCIVGTLRALDKTHEKLIQKVIKPLNADLMFCVSRLTPLDEDLLNYFNNFNVVDVCIYDDQKYGYENLCDDWSKKMDLEERWQECLKIEGNWLGGMKDKKGSGMHLIYNSWKLLERVKNLQSKGLNYQRYIITRSDFLWMEEHPPLSLLDPRYLWIPSGEDYFGYNDRHAVCSNENIHQYLNSFEYIINLKALDYLRDHTKNKIELNHEKYLKRHLDYGGIKVGRFKNIAYLTGDEKTLTNWRHSVITKNIDGKRYHFKYECELLSAIANSKEFHTHRDWKMMILRKPLIYESARLLIRSLVNRVRNIYI